jgi:hypothetical protein
MLEGKRQKLNFLRRLRPEATQDRDSRKLKIVGGSSSRTQFRAPGMAGLKIRACEVSLRTESPKLLFHSSEASTHSPPSSHFPPTPAALLTGSQRRGKELQPFNLHYSQREKEGRFGDDASLPGPSEVSFLGSYLQLTHSSPSSHTHTPQNYTHHPGWAPLLCPT